MKRSRNEMRKKRTLRMRAKIKGTKSRPRLVIYRSNTALSAQLVDDALHATILSASVKGKTIAVAKTLGADIAAIAKKKHITKVVFDRSGYRYHGVVAALATAARAGGLVF